VYEADISTINKILGIKDDGIFVGHMYGHENVRIVLDPETLLRLHFAIFGSTGSGKSYTVGVIVEEFLRLGYPVVIFDVHGEYSTLSMPNENGDEVAELIRLGLRPRKFEIRLFHPSQMTVGLEDLDIDAISEVTSMTPIMSDLLYLAFKHIDRIEYTLDNIRDSDQKKEWIDRLVRAVSVVASRWRFDNKTKIAIRRRLETLKELSIFGERLDINRLVGKGVATIIDISYGLTEYEKAVYVGLILKKTVRCKEKKTNTPTTGDRRGKPHIRTPRQGNL